MNYVGYYRVSTKKQGKSGLGLEAQQEVVRQFARMNGSLVAEYVEVESGRNDQRSELAKAMAHAKRLKAPLLIARLDRFSRRVSFISAMMEKGVQLIVAEMPHATEFQLHIFAALAQEERRLISERTKAALAQAKRRGLALGLNGAKLARINRERADKFARSLLTHLPPDWRSWSYVALADHLNARNVKAPMGGRFWAQTVKNCVTRIV